MMSSLWVNTKTVLRPLKNSLEHHLPGRLRVAAPVVQAYLGGDYLTRYTLVNFPSLYSPQTAYPCVYEVALYAPDGSRVGRRTLRIEPFGSVEVRPEELFGPDMPSLGMFTARIRSANPLTFAYKHLGVVTSHFYALYADKELSSFALVHPQTLVNATRGENMNWQSGYLLDAGKIRRLVAIQVNPTSQAVGVGLYLVRAGARSQHLCDMDGVIPAMGARKVIWDLPAIGLTEGLFSIAARGLPTNNAKPILLTYFADGAFTGMHA
jgi:hypothetical protein